MGIDEMAVVDENLKVKGIQNLRVVDASVMPEIPSANLNAPTLMTVSYTHLTLPTKRIV